MKKQIQQADLELFREHVQDAEPIEHGVAEPYRQRPPPVPRPRATELPEDAGRTALSESEVETHDFLEFARPGVQRRVVGDLQRGASRWSSRWTCTGSPSSSPAACSMSSSTECAHRRVRCARIIHGKGFGSSGRQPVLKQKVNYWLQALRPGARLLLRHPPRRRHRGRLRPAAQPEQGEAEICGRPVSG
jgi:DNA-nicking Smr family endonuclease